MENKIAFITGASKGIGLEIAKLFVENNYFVIGTSRSDFDLRAAIGNENCLHLKLDATNRNAVKESHKVLTKKNLIPSVLINNAGITRDQLFLRMKDDEWDKVIDNNLTSVFNISRIFIKSMVKAKLGRIINISSVAGLMGNAGQVNYSASKAGIGGFTRSLAKEVASRNITVNFIAPGFISSSMTEGLDDSMKNKILDEIPAQKFGNPNDIAFLALFLASNEASYINGQTISVDGGLFMN